MLLPAEIERAGCGTSSTCLPLSLGTPDFPLSPPLPSPMIHHLQSTGLKERRGVGRVHPVAARNKAAPFERHLASPPSAAKGQAERVHTLALSTSNGRPVVVLARPAT